jgi:peptidoglycan/xylan/chitin deacetylase (PgdA/CDA1 family)
VLVLGISSSLVLYARTPGPGNPSPTQPSSLTPTPRPQVGATPGPSPSVTPTHSPIATPLPTPSTTLPPATATPNPTPVVVLPEISWGNRASKQVIFTFDAGSGNTSITSILNTLSQYHVEGTFFLTGAWVATYPNDTKRIAAGGHAIYNHTYTHPHLIQISDTQMIEELVRTDNLIRSQVGFDSKPYFRAPYGERNARVLSVAASLGYRSVYWTIDAWDWKEGISALEVKGRILNNLQPGNIYLMHVGAPITGQILPEVFQEIRNRGYAINGLRQGF